MSDGSEQVGGVGNSAACAPSEWAMERARRIDFNCDGYDEHDPPPCGMCEEWHKEIARVLDAALLEGARRELAFVIGLIEHDAKLPLESIHALLVVRHRNRARVMWAPLPDLPKPPSIRDTIADNAAAAAFYEAHERHTLGDPTAPPLPPMPPVELGKPAGGALFTMNPLAAPPLVANPLASQAAVDALKLRPPEHCNGTYCLARFVHESAHCSCSCTACALAMRWRPRA